MRYNIKSIYKCVYLPDPLRLMLPNANAAITLANAKKDTWLDGIINTYATPRAILLIERSIPNHTFINPEEISEFI